MKHGAATSLPLACGLQPKPLLPRQKQPFTSTTQELRIMAFAFARQAVLIFGMAAGLSPVWAADGKVVYEKTCVACHASGVANAPKLGDKAAWAPRVATGKDTLFKTVISGKGAMPPRAGASDLKDDEIKAAIDFMLAAVK
jgi:cytochrome c5